MHNKGEKNIQPAGKLLARGTLGSDTRESSTRSLTPLRLSESRTAVASPQVHLDRE